MTVEVVGGASTPWGQYSGAGQEDVNTQDIRMPRLKIDGLTGEFVNSNSGERFTELDVVVLGLVKQRQMFLKDIGETSYPPICKSPDMERGFPTEPDDEKSEIYFSWEDSGFDPHIHNQIDPAFGRVVLPCEQCAFAQWSKDRRTNKNVPPPCAEVHTYPLLIIGPSGEEMPAILSIKSSSLANSKQFISSFAPIRRPFFTAVTRLSLRQATRGSVTYAICQFAPDLSTVTERDKWDGYMAAWENARQMLQTPPRPFEGQEETVQAARSSQGATPAAAQPAQWADYSEAAPDDNVTVSSTATVAPEPSSPPRPAPTAPTAARTAPAAPTRPAPVAPTRPAPTATTAPAAAQPIPGAVEDDDDLPF